MADEDDLILRANSALARRPRSSAVRELRSIRKRAMQVGNAVASSVCLVFVVQLLEASRAWRASERAARTLLRSSPQNIRAWAHVRIGLAQEKQKRFVGAHKSYKRALVYPASGPVPHEEARLGLERLARRRLVRA